MKDAQEAAKKVEEARAKAELAARDYLNALKTGDPEIIAAYKERLQEANDAYLAAKKEEEAANKAVQDASYRVSRESANVREAENKSYYGSGAGESTGTGAQNVEQPTQQQTVEQPVQQQSGGETNISFNNMLKAKLSSLTQKEAELAKQLEQKNKIYMIL